MHFKGLLLEGERSSGGLKPSPEPPRDGTEVWSPGGGAGAKDGRALPHTTLGGTISVSKTTFSFSLCLEAAHHLLVLLIKMLAVGDVRDVSEVGHRELGNLI